MDKHNCSGRENALFYRIREIVLKYANPSDEFNDIYIRFYVGWIGEDNVNWCLGLDEKELEDVVLKDWHWFIMTNPIEEPYVYEISTAKNINKYRGIVTENVSDVK